MSVGQKGRFRVAGVGKAGARGWGPEKQGLGTKARERKWEVGSGAKSKRAGTRPAPTFAADC